MAQVTFDATVVASPGSVLTGNFDAFQIVYEENWYPNSTNLVKTYDASGNVTITTNFATDPFGGSTAAKMSFSNSSSWAFINGICSAYSAVNEWTNYSVFIKIPTGETGIFQIFAGDTTSQAGYQYNFNVDASGKITYVSGGTNCSVDDYGNGWYRLKMSHIRPNVGKGNFQNGRNNALFDALVIGKGSLTTSTGTQFLYFGHQIARGQFVQPYRKTSGSAILPFGAYPKTINAQVTDLAPKFTNVGGLGQGTNSWNRFTNLSNVTVKQHDGPDPFGNYDAMEVIPTGAGNSFAQSSLNSGYTGNHFYWRPNVSYIKSIYAKRGTGAVSSVHFEQYQTTGTVPAFDLITNVSYNAPAAQCNVGNGWYRCMAKITVLPSATASGSNNYYVGGYGVGAVTSNIYLYGPQVEEAVELCNVNVWSANSTGITKNTSTGTITFDGTQADFGWMDLTTTQVSESRDYLITFTVTRTSGTVQVIIGSNNFPVNASGTYTFAMSASGAKAIVQSSAAPNKFIGSVSNISVCQCAPFQPAKSDAVYIGAQFRLGKDQRFPDCQPNYATNFITSSETISTFTPSGGTYLQNVITAPDGTLTADKFIEATDVTSIHRFAVSMPNTRKGYWTLSFYVKAAERSGIQVYHEDYDESRKWQQAAAGWNFSSTPTLYTAFTNSGSSIRHVSSTMTDVGNGWYRFTHTTYSNPAFTNGTTWYISLANASNQNYYNGDGTSGAYFWGFQVEPGKVAGPYTKTVGTAKNGFVSDFGVQKSQLFDLAFKMPNIVKYSSLKNSGDSNWIASAGYDLGVDYSISDPDGKRGARKLYTLSIAGPFRINAGSYIDVNGAVGASAGQTNYAGQIWLRVADGGANINVGSIQINDINAVNFASQPITSTWQKYTFTVNTVGQPYQFIDLEFSGTSLNRAIHVYGAQLELGTTNSTYVETGAQKITGLYSQARFL